jgi:membrane dipeptidase
MLSVIKKAKERTLEILDVSKEEIEKGLELHKKSIIIDSMAQDPFILSENMTKKIDDMLDIGKSVNDIRAILENMQRLEFLKNDKIRDEYIQAWNNSGVTCISQTVNNNLQGRGSFEGTIKNMSSSMIKFDLLKEVFIKGLSVEDIRRAKKEGKHAVIWNFQNTLMLGGGYDINIELERLNLFYTLGIRIIQLTYNLRNFVGDGCTERYESGLSYFGLRVVERMNELGILVDTSHCGYQTTLDAVEASKVPVAATHTGCNKVYKHDRGKTDEELLAIAEKGGYVGVYMVPKFIGEIGTIKEWLDHVDYLVDLIGVKNVGIGTDNRYSTPDPPRLKAKIIEEATQPISGNWWWLGWREEHQISSDNPAWEESKDGSLAWINWPYYAVGLVSRGYSDKEIEGILGGNFLRILEKVIN